MEGPVPSDDDFVADPFPFFLLLGRFWSLHSSAAALLYGVELFNNS